MKKTSIAIVNYEEAMGIHGILTKYAESLERELLLLGYTAKVVSKPDKESDINHHLNFISYKPSGKIDTLMVTHISGDKNQSEEKKIGILKEGLKTSFGICMSKSLMEKCIQSGIPKKKLDFAPHAHDEFQRRPKIIAICTNIYPDGRKREDMFVDMFRSIQDKKRILFRIIGKGWQPILERLTNEGIQAQWQPEFNKELYASVLGTADYLLYTGDEDSLAQSMVDAKYFGLPIIAPPNKDLTVDIPFKNQKELNEIVRGFETSEVDDWTWKNYAMKHCKIWEQEYNKKYGK